MGDLRDRRDDRLLERGLRIFGVADRIEAVGNLARLERFSVARGQRGAEFGFVRIGGLVQVDMHEELLAQRRDQPHQRR